MKKAILFIAAVLCAVAVNAKTLYLKAGEVDFTVDGAVVAIWTWGGSSADAWSVFAPTSYDGYSSTEIAEGRTGGKIVRFPGGTTPAWENVTIWNQTGDLVWDSTKDCMELTPNPDNSWDGLTGVKWTTFDASSITPTTYYLTGDGTWTGGAEWDPKAAEIKDGKIELNLEEGTYKCKITNGTWNRNWGMSAVGEDCTNVQPAGDDNGNIVFTLAKATKVTITFDGSKVCISAEGGDDVVIPQKTKYASAVPSQSTDVMLQAFYYDSYEDHKYTNAGSFPNTKWKSLISQASELGSFFDLVWLPPSAKSSGGTGYHPSQYSNQNSDWGSRAELQQFINAMHNSPLKTKVVADIVVNHANNKSSWCDFYEYDFGSYGKFTPQASWICKTDEVNYASGAGSCKGKATGKDDDGYGGDANYADARDWDHQNSEVQRMCRAYLQWMYNEIGYDGWRYDYCKGFWNGHINDYNKASGAYFSVMEYWDGNPQTLKSRIADAGNNTMTFDFATKYTAINDPDNKDKGIAGGDYSTCKGAGLPGIGMSKYAVTFVDSHDTFERDVNEFLGKDNSLKAANKDKLLQANAYILSMPGIPCVFYPHWYKYKDEIGKMIMARHAAQVHSESAVDDEADASGYKAVVTGKNGGSLILLLGNRVSQSIGSDYKLAVKGSGYAMYYKAASGTTNELCLIVTPGSSVFKDATNGIDVNIKTIALSGTPTIYYTTDGTEPTTSSNKLTGTKLNFKQTTTLKVMAVNGSTQTPVQTYTYTYKEPQTTPIVVKFYKAWGWSKVNLYAWTADGELLGKWPGKELTDQDENGYYMYQFDASLKEVNFIFNCGKDCDQTGDLWTDEDVCYSWSGGAEKLEPECETPTGVEDIAVYPDTRSVNIYPNPVQNTLNIETEQTISAASVYTITGQCMKTETGDVRQLNVGGMSAGMYILNLRMQNGKQTTQLFIKQ